MESCGKSAVKLVTLVARHFPGIFVFLHFPLKLSNCSYGIFLRLCWVLRKNREKKGKVIFFLKIKETLESKIRLTVRTVHGIQFHLLIVILVRFRLIGWALNISMHDF